jgi:hypothetical protein
MAVNMVSTPEEEIAWERAKARAREQYLDATGECFYRIVMAIYRKMGSLPASIQVIAIEPTSPAISDDPGDEE